MEQMGNNTSQSGKTFAVDLRWPAERTAGDGNVCARLRLRFVLTDRPLPFGVVVKLDVDVIECGE
jgi:hypothetical protein